ncbi:MAG: hypothetical protein K2K21_00605 [Lachnospiraceae bacterium]|nr:hypothetical protein [Lachnospiraceae bacterium]
MQLKLTWRVEGRSDMDLLVSDDQTILETMQILEEKGLLARKTAETVKYIKTLRADHQANVLLTYSEADIYSGDILVLKSSADK